jgi:Kef-type K+ transport system membrane component KefB
VLIRRRRVSEKLWFIAAIWMALVLLASLISIRTGLAVAPVEIVLGVIGGNSHLLYSTAWSDFLASLGSVLPTFLAGAETVLALGLLFACSSLWMLAFVSVTALVLWSQPAGVFTIGEEE